MGSVSCSGRQKQALEGRAVGRASSARVGVGVAASETNWQTAGSDCKGQPNGSNGVPDGARNGGLVDRLRRPLTGTGTGTGTGTTLARHQGGTQQAQRALFMRRNGITYCMYGGDGGLARAGPYY